MTIIYPKVHHHEHPLLGHVEALHGHITGTNDAVPEPELYAHILKWRHDNWLPSLKGWESYDDAVRSLIRFVLDEWKAFNVKR